MYYEFRPRLSRALKLLEIIVVVIQHGFRLRDVPHKRNVFVRTTELYKMVYGVWQATKLGAKRLSEQATKRLKDMAAAAISRREHALYEAREAMVRHK